MDALQEAQKGYSYNLREMLRDCYDATWDAARQRIVSPDGCTAGLIRARREFAGLAGVIQSDEPGMSERLRAKRMAEFDRRFAVGQGSGIGDTIGAVIKRAGGGR